MQLSEHRRARPARRTDRLHGPGHDAAQCFHGAGICGSRSLGREGDEDLFEGLSFILRADAFDILNHPELRAAVGQRAVVELWPDHRRHALPPVMAARRGSFRSARSSSSRPLTVCSCTSIVPHPFAFYWRMGGRTGEPRAEGAAGRTTTLRRLDFFDYDRSSICGSVFSMGGTMLGIGRNKEIRYTMTRDDLRSSSTSLRTARILIATYLLLGLNAWSQTGSTAPASQPSVAPPQATTWPAVDGTVLLPNFRFGTGETLPDSISTTSRSALRTATPPATSTTPCFSCTAPAATRHSLLNPALLRRPLRPRPAARHHTNTSSSFPTTSARATVSKPSDGLKMNFPHYDYDDMVRSQHQMLLEGLHVDHLRLILGTSMGCMQSFVWGETYPGFADALMPLACLPTEIAGRNRMMRYMAIENIKRDPAWNNGNYTTEPVYGIRTANEMLFIMGSSPLLSRRPHPPASRREVRRQLPRRAPSPHTDANNFIYYVDATRNYNPSPTWSASPCRSCRSTPPTTSSIRPSSASPKSSSSRCPSTLRPHPHLRPDPRPRHPHRRPPSGRTTSSSS